MKICEIEHQDLSAYKMRTVNKPYVSGNLSNDYKSIVSKYKDLISKYTVIPKSPRDKLFASSQVRYLQNNIKDIQDLCIDILNSHTDIDADNINDMLYKMNNTLTALDNKLIQ